MGVDVRSGRSRLVLVLVLLVALPGAASAVPSQSGAPFVTHGVVVGDVTARSAVLWTRADRAATLNVRLSGGGHGAVPRVQVVAEDDFTGSCAVDWPAPGYDLRLQGRVQPRRSRARARGRPLHGSFRTAPASGRRGCRPLRLRWGRRWPERLPRCCGRGYPIFATILDRAAGVLRRPRGHGLRRRRVPHRRRARERLRSPGRRPGDRRRVVSARTGATTAPTRERRGSSPRTTCYAVWDDHEVRDDFGPPAGTNGDRSVSGARRGGVPRLGARWRRRGYRCIARFRWGRHLELFLLDARGQ